MFKLTVVAGPNRGSSYPINEGETSIGRQTGNEIVLPSSKVSKKHCTLVVSNADVIVKDQGSSNGTYVNGVLTKARKLNSGDKISVGEYVLELTRPAQGSKALVMPSAIPGGQGAQIIQFPGAGASAGATPPPAGPGAGMPDFNASAAQRPQNLKERLLHIFENSLMPTFYGLLLKYEWRMVALGLVGAFLFLNLLISVYPMVESGKATVLRESGRRAQFMARQIAELNTAALAARQESRAGVGSIDREEGVRMAVLADLDSRIIAPSEKTNQYLTSGSEAQLAVAARGAFRNGRETGVLKEADGLVVAIEPVKVLNAQIGKNVVVAMAIVSVDASLSLPDLGELGVIYSQTLIFTGLLAALVFMILYRLTLRPLLVLNEDMDKALRGDMAQVTHEFKWEELDPLWDIIGSALQRLPKGGDSSGGGSFDVGASGPSADDVIGPVKMLGAASKLGVVLCDSAKKILYINPVFEEISGIRSDGSIGQDIASVARDQSLGALMQDLYDRAPVGGEGVSEDYEFSGMNYKVHVAAFGMPGAAAKAYMIVAVKPEG